MIAYGNNSTNSKISLPIRSMKSHSCYCTCGPLGLQRGLGRSIGTLLDEETSKIYMTAGRSLNLLLVDWSVRSGTRHVRHR